MSLLGFGMGTMLANFHMCGVLLVVVGRLKTILQPPPSTFDIRGG